MKVLIFIAILGCVSRCLDGKDLNPPIFPEEDDKVNGNVAEHLEARKIPFEPEGLPLLLKTLRLRPGSDEYNRIVEEFIKNRRPKRSPGDKLPPIHHDEDGELGFDDDILIKRGANDDQGLPLLLKTLRLREGSAEYQRIIDEFLRNKGHLKGDDDGKQAGDDEPRLLGEPLIGKNRHPSGKDEKPKDDEELPLPGEPLISGNRHPLHHDPEGNDEPGVPGEPLIGGNRHPLGNDEKPKDDEELPLPGEPLISGNRHPLHHDPEGNDEPQLPGEPLIGGNRHPVGGNTHDEDKPGPEGNDKPLIGGIRHPLGNDKKPKDDEEELPLPGEPLIGGNRHPVGGNPHDPEDNDDPRLPGEPLIGGNRHPLSGTHNNENKPAKPSLPLLLKTLRLRPGSSEYQRVIDEFLKAHGIASNGDEDNAEVPLLGEHLIGKNRHPVSQREKRDIEIPDDNRPPEWKAGDKLLDKIREDKRKGETKDELVVPDGADKLNNPKGLPLLLKTLRLREGSAEYQRILDEFLNGKKHQGPGIAISKGHHDSGEDDDDDHGHGHPLFGAKLIAALPKPIESGEKPKIACKEEDRQQVLRCFRGFLKNFGLKVKNDKLPSYDEVNKIIKLVSFEEGQKYWKNFEGCYKSTPEACYHAEELAYITQSFEDSETFASFFSFFEFATKSLHNFQETKCFNGVLREILNDPSHQGTTTLCDYYNNIFSIIIEEFNKRCAKTNPQEGDVKELLKFINRSRMGSWCPTLYDDLFHN